MSDDYFCLVSYYISFDVHFSVVYINRRGKLKSLLDVLYCRVTALDK